MDYFLAYWLFFPHYCFFSHIKQNTAHFFCECARNELPLHKILKIVQ